MFLQLDNSARIIGMSGVVTIPVLGAPLSSFASIIFVVDIQLRRCVAVFLFYGISGAIRSGLSPSSHQQFDRLLSSGLRGRSNDIFVHKAEVLSEDFKFGTYIFEISRRDKQMNFLRTENFRHCEKLVLEKLAGTSAVTVSGPTPICVEVSDVPNNLTSIHDHSIHEAFSRVLQCLLVHTSLPYLEDLLNVFFSNSYSHKAFLFDIYSRIFVATGNSPVDSVRLSLCCKCLSMLSSFSSLYKYVTNTPKLMIWLFMRMVLQV